MPSTTESSFLTLAQGERQRLTDLATNKSCSDTASNRRKHASKPTKSRQQLIPQTQKIRKNYPYLIMID
ncbi:hypothetical protein SynBIOSU31_00355 [Synechococcus sp. BIOS-U3-1]|nr:hypothetical protein SynBIOSU31_00355 [Synechococcus sp. BIOS-U3-1]